jgi:hypothetical protein
MTVVDIFILKKGHPVWMVTGVLDMLLVATLWILLKKGKSAYSISCALIYFFYHVFAVVCVYKEWLPTQWNSNSKSLLDGSILITFIAVNSIPLSDFRQTAFITFPLFLATSYAQIKA